MKAQLSTHWKFESVHPKDIDFEEIGESVTRKNPIAIVKGSYKGVMTSFKHPKTITIDENYVVVHKSLYEKSVVTGIMPPEHPTHDSRQAIPGSETWIYYGIPTGQISTWIKWAKAVKAARWGDKDRRKVTFEVTLPTI